MIPSRLKQNWMLTLYISCGKRRPIRLFGWRGRYLRWRSSYSRQISGWYIYVVFVQLHTLFWTSQRSLIALFPSVKHVPAWFPGAEFQKIAQKGLKLSHDMRYIPYEDSKRKIVHVLLHSLTYQPLIDGPLAERWREAVVHTGYGWAEGLWGRQVNWGGRCLDLGCGWNGVCR